MDASVKLELTSACQKKPTTQEQIRQQVTWIRSNSRGRLTQAKRAGRGILLNTYSSKGGVCRIHRHPHRAGSCNSTHLSPEVQRCWGRFYTIEAREPNNISTPNDDAASTSSIVDQEYVLVDPTTGPQDQLPQGVSVGDFNLQSMETIRLRWIKTLAEEPLASRMSRNEVHVESCRFTGMSCERWTLKHETQLTWAMDKINEARREQDELLIKVEELNERVVELTTRLNQGENQIRSVERICTFRTSDFHTQLH